MRRQCLFLAVFAIVFIFISCASSENVKISLDFKDADISSVLKAISLKSGVNIVAGKEVTGVVSVRLQDVDWEQALDIILKTYGFIYERDGNVIRVTTLENLGKENLQTEVFTLNYGKAKQVTDSISEMLTERGKLKYDERTNVVVVTDIPTNLYKIGKVVEKLDRKTAQVLIEAKLIETTLDNDDKLGIEWTAKVTVTGSKRPTTFPFDRDRSTPFSGGEKNSAGEFFPLGLPGSTSSTSNFQNSTRPIFPYAEKTDFSFGTLNFAEFQAVIEMLKTRSNTKIVSNPRVTTLNNEKAEIVVGEILNLPSFERNDTTGQFEVTGYEERDVGIKLEVTPHINEVGDIVVELHPEVSALLGYDTLTADLKAPRFSTREATTQIMIKNGETIAIGGLVKENIVDTVKKIPILGDIPIIGIPFTKKEKTVDKTDLLIFVTVRLINAEGASEKIAVSPVEVSEPPKGVEMKPTEPEKNQEGNKGLLYKKRD